jgi:hypothetical protein
MYQVNYNGLRKRESYEEIVAILEHDTTKLQYPDRVQPGKREGIHTFQMLLMQG